MRFPSYEIAYEDMDKIDDERPKRVRRNSVPEIDDFMSWTLAASIANPNLLSNAEMWQEEGLLKDENEGEIAFRFKPYNQAIMKTYLKNHPKAVVADQSLLQNSVMVEPST